MINYGYNEYSEFPKAERDLYIQPEKTMPTSLKQQAEEIIEAVDYEIQTVEQQAQSLDNETLSGFDKLFNRLSKIVNDVDIAAAEERVNALRQKN